MKEIDNSILIEWFKKSTKERKAKELAALIHLCYEAHSRRIGWETQEECRGTFEELPEANKKVMIATAHDILDALT